MKRRTLLAIAGVVAVVAVAGTGALAAGGSPTVTLRIEGAKKTLLVPTDVKAGHGSITKYGAPKGQCPAQSAQGALDVATHGDWKGKWYPSYHEYLITSIRGETPKGHDFWEFFVDDKSSNVGACDVKLHAGEQLLFADTDGKSYPSALKAPSSVESGESFEVTLVGFNAKGNAKPLSGVKLTGGGTHATTNSHGKASITDKKPGTLVLTASPKGYIRTEVVVKVTK